MGNGNIGRIGNFHLVLLNKSAMLHIHIIYFNSVAVPLCIGRNICHISFLLHSNNLHFRADALFVLLIAGHLPVNKAHKKQMSASLMPVFPLRLL